MDTFMKRRKFKLHYVKKKFRVLHLNDSERQFIEDCSTL